MSMLFTLVFILALCSCGNAGKEPEAGEAQETRASEKPVFPTGLFMLKYLGNEAGEYVPESNEFLDFLNQPTTLLKMMWADNTTIWCEIGEDGVGTYCGGNYEPTKMDFNTDEPGMLLFGGVRNYDAGSGEYLTEEQLVPYFFDEETCVFWFEEEPGFWAVMEPCSQEKLDLVFTGMGGSVPLSEAVIGDFVCMGKYVQDEQQQALMPIYWRVIDENEGKLLLLSDKLLDSFSYNYNPDHAVLTDVTWENSSIRAFLNDREAGFLTMFTEDELARMQTTHLENKSANQELMAQWGSFEDQGDKTYSDLSVQSRPDDPDTDDKVFLLSYQEVLRCFGEPTEEPTEEEYPFSDMKMNPAWKAYVTDAVRTGYFGDDRSGAWMTRTLCNSHTEEDMVVYISGSGQVFDYYTYVPLFIRPAVWVSVR